ncbi:type a von willebrand factor domain-containing protein [Stylonychia lemnae]|uniref:Type a von willebrand factor domain-containing protein n=1 Tax=Stylonychia lemnae TaxID=5949 RepID=A0A077ZV47_STYLE|nr:type a von willebrand factor domain-containing protein [Stylonychia lemnae]|eukprot:CDW73759.1 type a von willebrand factor domain-containing protein [Stylonychia lemnae]
MYSASNKAYLSKRIIEQYKHEKERRVKSEITQNQMFQIEEQQDEDDDQMNEKSQEMISSSVQQKHVKEEIKFKPKKQEREVSSLLSNDCYEVEEEEKVEEKSEFEEEEDNESAESMDSEELGDDIDDYKAYESYQVQMLQKQIKELQNYIKEGQKKENYSIVDKAQNSFGGASQSTLQQRVEQASLFSSQENESDSNMTFGKAQPQIDFRKQMKPQHQMFGYQEPEESQKEFYKYNPKTKNTAELKKVKRRKYKQEVDTNVFQISMACLKDQSELATGDPCFCTNCDAVFNLYSKIEESKAEEEQIWHCEFCNHQNKVQFEPEELPKTESVHYIIEAAEQIIDKNNPVTGQKDISVIFCIDISGSMCVSLPVAGHHQIKGDRMKDISAQLMKFGDGSNQRLQGDHNVTYVSRLQCIKLAIEKQIDEMQRLYPDRKIGIVTFNSEVTVIGDGTQIPITIAGDKLNDYDTLFQSGIQSHQIALRKPIKETKKHLKQKLLGLEEKGLTALGPAVLTAIAMAGEGAPGSSVIVCTDGLSNVGLGNLDEIFTEEQHQEIDQIYNRMGEYAMSKGVTVSIVSIEGEECNIDTISRLSDFTGGDVQRVKPQDLIENIQNILSLPTLATNVQVKVKIHKGLQYRNEDPQNLSADKTILLRDLGNVNEGTEITFEYKLKNIKKLLEMEDIDLEKLKHFPFQAQIAYTSLDGARCILVITNQVETSNDRNELMQQANFDILGVNAIQQTAKFARGGDFVKAQVNAKAWSRHLERDSNDEEQNECLMNFRGNVNSIYNAIAAERSNGSNSNMMMGSSSQSKQYVYTSDSNSNIRQRGATRFNDNLSHQVFAAKQMTVKKIQKKNT